ncbi:zinc finger protein 28-like [Paramacrobiotus metropolitanus]|uniref:zinc finger protein 28-like n=1 Tax=Paramacrobiotus metropolitanus TaxID=2943436 RepID=UPI0024463D2D|nr:zinc finger protein 28-like [Paramacrobiotus metropolitanus]
MSLQSSELRGFLTSFNAKFASRLTEYYTSRHPGQSAFKKYVRPSSNSNNNTHNQNSHSTKMDDDKRSSVIKFACSAVDTQPLDLSVPKPSTSTKSKKTISLAKQHEPVSLCKADSEEKTLTESLSDEKLVGIKKSSKLGQEFEVEKADGRAECGLCGKLYATKKCLKIHLRLHYGIKPYQCSFCPKSFAQSNVLKAHIAYHTGRRDWVCEICNKAFTQSAHLRTHRKTHSSQKDYQCPYCQRCFSSKQRCETHIRHHTGEPNYRYVCLACDKCFTRSESLRYHENSVHRGFRPYICSDRSCGKTFSRQSSLKRHIRSVHGLKQEQESTPEVETATPSVVDVPPPVGAGSNPPIVRPICHVAPPFFNHLVRYNSADVDCSGI